LDSKSIISPSSSIISIPRMPEVVISNTIANCSPIKNKTIVAATAITACYSFHHVCVRHAEQLPHFCSFPLLTATPVPTSLTALHMQMQHAHPTPPTHPLPGILSDNIPPMPHCRLKGSDNFLCNTPFPTPPCPAGYSVRFFYFIRSSD
jgi:hypothetical protein